MANSYPAALTNAVAATAPNGATSGSYTLIAEYNLGAAPPHEVMLDVTLKPALTPSSTAKQTVLFMASSSDGTSWSDAPSATTEANSRAIGYIAHPDATASRPAAIPLSPHFAGALARYIRIYAKNDTGVAYDTTGNSIVATPELFG